ncbi:MAG: aminopeptidase [Lachnospiraceae bacterium]|nr:aminopeptidase [Lachnospiraceae bacterium]
MSVIEERYELAKGRIKELAEEVQGIYSDYIRKSAFLFQTVSEILESEEKRPDYRLWNDRLYSEIAGRAYESSYANPAYAIKQFGKKTGQYLCWYYAQFRDAITAAYEKDKYEVTLRMELFLQAAAVIFEEEEADRYLKETMYYYIHDYDTEQMEKNIRQMLCPENSLIYRIVMESDFTDTDYLYRYGEYITENEKKMASFLASLPEETLASMAKTYTEGYRKGFEVAGIDLSKKKTVQIRFHIGFEPMVRQAVLQFREMGLETVFTRRTNTKAIGVVSTLPNKQYQYDHRYDDALYLNKALVQERLKIVERLYETYKEQAAVYAGPAVIEVFGEELFVPAVKKESPSYTKEQETLSIEYKREYSLIQNKYIPQDSYSFTIIAYPIPEIGEQFEEIFKETIKVNTLDMDEYRRIQQVMIDALDLGEKVHVTGRGKNHTNIWIQLHKLEHPEKQTNFENCLADVNIPVGEVFTSPVLTGTEGILHVTQVYLNELRYENLEFTFADGMVTDYNCSNYEKEEENKKYVKENVLHNRDTLPIGEFAVGTNTTAYVMGRKYGIEAKLPILIAEKTGPHFALGDTCYSMSEDVVLHNPDGKEIIAKENECSALRHSNIANAYFNCHTDITIPYDELGDIIIFTKEGKEITLIKDGRFVLPGTESLNMEEMYYG